MAKIFDRLFYVGPLALGDNFVNAGLVHHFADRSLELHVPVWPIHYDTVSCLYQDWPNIKVVALGHYDFGENQYVEEHKLARILPTDLIRTKIEGVIMAPLWDIQTYANYDLPFSLRYSNFRLPKHIEGSEELYQKLSGGEPYVLVHKRSFKYPNGIPINIEEFRKHSGLPEIKIIEIQEGITSNMMQYVTLIERAEEIHCVASSFHCLVDSIHTRTKAKLFFHDIRIDAVMKVNSSENGYCWNIVNYPTKI
jgi:hypothetical protein